jgi:hypothetical protein
MGLVFYKQDAYYSYGFESHFVYSQNSSFWDDVLVIVHINWDRFEVIKSFLNIYGCQFKNVAFYSNGDSSSVEEFYYHSKKFWKIQVNLSNDEDVLKKGYFAYILIADAIERFPGSGGYLFMHDDVFPNFQMLTKLDKRKNWVTHPFGILPNLNTTMNDWYWFQSPYGSSAIKKMLRDIGFHDFQLSIF